MAISLPKNLDDVSANQEFKVAEPGTYTLEVKTAKAGISQNKNTKVDFRHEIIDDDEFTGVGIFDTITITEAALFRLKQFSLATGVEIEGEFEPEDFIGETFEAVIDCEPMQNRDGTPKLTDDGEPALRNVIKSFKFDN